MRGVGVRGTEGESVTLLSPSKGSTFIWTGRSTSGKVMSVEAHRSPHAVEVASQGEGAQEEYLDGPDQLIPGAEGEEKAKL